MRVGKGRHHLMTYLEEKSATKTYKVHTQLQSNKRWRATNNSNQKDKSRGMIGTSNSALVAVTRKPKRERDERLREIEGETRRENWRKGHIPWEKSVGKL